MDVAVWYPSFRDSRDIFLDGWSIRVSKDNAATPGKYPVILISHDAAASRLASHDLAAHLARHGFIVIAPTHPGDNASDTAAFFRAANFADRPRQLIQALEAAAGHPAIGPLLDRSRIGLLGVGTGAATVLQVAGASPDLSRLATYCPPAISLDPLCSNWARSFHPGMQREFASLLSAHGSEYFSPSFADAGQQENFSAGPASMPGTAMQNTAGETDADSPLTEQISGPVESGGQEVEAPGPIPEQISTPDTSYYITIQAVGLLTPGSVGLFPDTALHSFTPMVGVMAAGSDERYPLADTADRLLALLPQRPFSRVLPEATHADLQAPCPPVYQDSFTAICGNPSSSANDARKMRNEFFTRFFQNTLGHPLPPPEPLTQPAGQPPR